MLEEASLLSEQTRKSYEWLKDVRAKSIEQWKVNFPEEWRTHPNRTLYDTVKETVLPPRSPLKRKREEEASNSAKKPRQEPE